MDPYEIPREVLEGFRTPFEVLGVGVGPVPWMLPRLAMFAAATPLLSPFRGPCRSLYSFFVGRHSASNYRTSTGLLYGFYMASIGLLYGSYMTSIGLL